MVDRNDKFFCKNFGSGLSDFSSRLAPSTGAYLRQNRIIPAPDFYNIRLKFLHICFHGSMMLEWG